MKIGLFIISLLMISISFSYGQFTFGISPGIGLNSAYFGYKADSKLVPFVGFQYMNGTMTSEESGKEYDYELYRIVSYSDKEKLTANLFIPNIGLKYYIKQHNALQAFLSLNLSKPLLSAKQIEDDEEDEDFKEMIKGISIWGSELGFGVEYFFDEDFSLGGEFGLRYLHFKYEESNNREIYDPNSGVTQNVEIVESLKYNISPTFTRVSLNFYF